MADPQITSRQNPRVKRACELRQRRWRDRRGLFLIDGVREIDRALDARMSGPEAFVCEAFFRTPEARVLLRRLTDLGVEILHVSLDVFRKLAYGERQEGFVLVAATPDRSLETFRSSTLAARGTVAVVENVEKPGNLGAILRSADGAGVDAVFAVDGRTDLFHANTIRASLGTVFADSIRVGTAERALGWLADREYQIVAARPDADRTYDEIDYRIPTAIVLGSEAGGLSALWQAADVMPVRLPMAGAADSLNVSATAAVLFYEALRQRRSQGS